MDLLTAEALGSGGFVALVGAIFWLLVRGQIVTARELNNMKLDRDEWRQIAKEQAPLIANFAAGQEKLTVAIETTNHLLRSLPSPVDREAS